MRSTITDRRMDVLEYMSAHPEPAPASVIAAGTDLGVHTAETFLRSLKDREQRALVRELDDKTWQIVPDRVVVRQVTRVIGPRNEDQWVDRTLAGLVRSAGTRVGR